MESGQTKGNETVSKNITAGMRHIKHELGEAKLKGTPRRVVVLNFSFVDALVSLHIQPIGIADDKQKDRIIQPLVSKVGPYTSVGSRKEPNLEMIASLKPDLIIADWKRHKAIYEDLQGIAPTLVLKSLEADYDENIASFQTIADAMNKQVEGRKRLQQHAKLIETWKAKIPIQDVKQTVMSVAVRKNSFKAHTSSSYVGTILNKIGLTNAIQDPSEAYAELTLEQLLTYDPDVLFLMKTAGEKTIVDEWSKNPLWKKLKAVKKKMVFEVKRNLWTRWRGMVSGEMMIKEAVHHLYGN